MRVLVLDNGDPRPGDLLEPLKELGAVCDVRPAGSLGILEIRSMTPQPQRILLTPGPGSPEDTGASREVALQMAGVTPILGVGLGLQVIASVARGRLVPPRTVGAPKAVSTFRHDGKNLFSGLPSPFEALPDPNRTLVLDHRQTHDLEASAWDEDGTVVACRLWALGIEGIQVDTRWFSTQLGNDMLFNFLYQAQVW